MLAKQKKARMAKARAHIKRRAKQKKAARKEKKVKKAVKKTIWRAGKIAKGAIRACKRRLAKAKKAARKKKNAAKKAARKTKKASKKAKKAVKKKARKAKKAAKKTIRKTKKAARKARRAAKRAAKRAGKSPDTQTLCCPRSGHCFQFCHRKCPSFKVEGIGSIYAQYKLAKESRRNKDDNFKSRRGKPHKLKNIKRAIAGTTRSWGSTKPCTTPKFKGKTGMCENKSLFKKRKGPTSATSFNDEKATLASNKGCVLKWGFNRKVFKKRPGIQEVRLGSSAVVQQEERTKKLADKIPKDYTVDEIFATLCNIKTGVSACNAVWSIEGCLQENALENQQL